MIQQASTEVQALDGTVLGRRRRPWPVEVSPTVAGWVDTSLGSIRRRTMRTQRASRSVDVEVEFKRLRIQWREETIFTSDFIEKILNSAYQSIIGLGPAVVPHILASLKVQPDHWHWALSAITREDPVPDDAAGDVVAIAEAWLAWGRQQGLV